MTLFSNVPSAESVADADYVLGLQGSTGPGTGNTAKMTLQQIVNLVGTGPFSSLSVTGNASIGGALTIVGGRINAANLPTSNTGLNPGDLYVNGGVLCVA